MSIKIITDSASDILQEDSKKLGIDVLPLKTYFQNEEYLDGINITHKEFYEKLIESTDLPTTSQINPFQYQECFEKYKDNDVIVITLSKKMSGCYQSAVLASEEFDNVRVIDSENVSLGQQILVKYAIRLVNEGKSAKEVEEILNRDKKKVTVLALMDTLEYLKKGGRINSTKALIGTLLSIKPVVGIVDGKVVMIGKARGSKNAHNVLHSKVEESGGIDFDMPFLTAYTGLSDAKLLKYIEDSKDMYDIDMNQIPISTIGSTVGTYAGPGAIGFAYFHKEEK